MAWTKRQTFTTFYIIFAVSLVLMIVYLSCFHIFYKKQPEWFKNSLMSLTFASFGTGYGCIWFRINRAGSPLCIAGHAIWHILVFAVMVYTRRFFYHKFMMQGNLERWFYDYNLPLITYPLYLIQLLLSFHFMVFRTGINPTDRAFRTELHAFGGVLIYIYIFFDAVFFTCEAYRYNHADMYFMTPFYLLSGIFCIFFLLLTPYFEWRRMQNLMKSRPSKPSISRRSSKTSIRSTSQISLQVPQRSHSAATMQF